MISGSMQCQFLLLAVCVILHPSVAADEECKDVSGKNHQVYLSVSSKRNDIGEWRTSFFANKSARIEPEIVDVDVTRKYTECQGIHVFSIAGVVKDHSQKDSPEDLFFKKGSSDAAITNDGRTLTRINPGGWGSAITQRPLMDDEIFTVRLDKKESKKGWVVGIGVTTFSPEALEPVPNHLHHMKSGVWMFYHDHLYQNGAIINKNYAKTDLKYTEVGQKVGVMRSRFGNLHLFINGVDQGPAASNMPKTLWGAFDLHGDALQGTIVDA